MKSTLPLWCASLILSSCAITQENPMNIYVPPTLSSAAMDELRCEGVKAWRAAGYGNVSSNILVFSTDVRYWPISGDVRGIPVKKDGSTDAEGLPINMQMKGNMVIARKRSYEIPGILLALLYWTGGTNYVEAPVNVRYHEPDDSSRKKFRAVWDAEEYQFSRED